MMWSLARVVLYFISGLTLNFGFSNPTITNDSKSRLDEYKEDFCYNEGTCFFNENLDHPRCFCDDKCSIFRDCCLDADSRIVTETTDTTLQANMSCETVEVGMGIDSVRGIFMITECSRKYLYNKSVNYFSFPVVGTNGTVYKDEKIALCNRVLEYDKFEIDIFFDTCKRIPIPPFALLNADLDNVIDRSKRTGCTIRVKSPAHLNTRPCWKNKAMNKMDHFPSAGRDPTKCTQYRNPIFVSNNYFRNYFCIPQNSTTFTDVNENKTIECRFHDNRVKSIGYSFGDLFTFTWRSSQDKCKTVDEVSFHVSLKLTCTHINSHHLF